jgi:prepilin signal peptidase PulO-like enzyme (type II secretory pathway)
MLFFWFSFLFIFGLVIGSFLNVLTMRIANDEPMSGARSFCPHCRHKLAAADLVPLFSFLWLKGSCRYCRAPISWQYPIVELTTALAFMLVAWAHWQGWASGDGAIWLLRDLFFTTGLLALFIFDYQWYIVPDEVSLPTALSAFIINLSLGIDWQTLVLGSIVGGGIYWLLWVGSQGRWVGSGDIRLGLVLGSMLGLSGTFVAIYIAYLIGGAAAAYLLFTKRKELGGMLPMGTFLTVGAFIVLLTNARLPEFLKIFF